MQAKIIPFISQEALQKRVKELGHSIATKYPTDDILLVSVDHLEHTFAQDLKKSIGERAEVTHLERYLEKRKKWCVVLVHYLIESGERLEQIYNQFQHKNSTERKVFSVSLLQRITEKKVVREPEYLGFSIPDECVVGYGMGIQGEYDSLPHIAIYDAS